MSNPIGKLFLMMGAPGSGKTTYIKRFLKDWDKYISRDDIRFALLNSEDNYFAKEDQVFNFFAQTIASSLMNSKYYRVFADATHLTAASRSKLLNAINDILTLEYDKSIVDFEINVIWLKTPLSVCIKRNEKREGRAKIPINNLKEMFYRIEEPSSHEIIDYVYIIDYYSKTVKCMWLQNPALEGLEY